MRKLFLHIAVSFDGYIEDENHELDWHFADAEFESYLNDTLRSIDTMIFGRKAFELLAQYWPTAEDNPAFAPNPADLSHHIEAARMMNSKRKIAISNTLKSTDWANSTIIGGDVAAEIEALKKTPGKDIALFAGANVANSFMRLGLIDEYRVIVNPIFLGGGTPLFEGGCARTELEVLEVRRFNAGGVLLRYRPVNATG